MGNKATSRLEKLKRTPEPTDEQRVELELIKLKSELPEPDYSRHVNNYLAQLDHGSIAFSLLGYEQLMELGYTLDEMVDKTLSLSADGIVGYGMQSREHDYWVRHRQNSMSLYVCAMHAGIVLGHFSMTPVFAREKDEFLQGKRPETAFTAMPAGAAGKEPHYVYISAVVVRPAFRNTAVATSLMRQGYRLLTKYLAEHPLAQGYFAEAYSPSGRRLCKMFGMVNSADDYFVKERKDSPRP